MLNGRFNVGMGNVAELQAAIVLAQGAILIDEFDPQIMDDVRRTSILWNRIDKRPAPGETTGGFDQTAVQTGRAAPRRNLSFSAGNATRSQRTPKTVKAIVADTQFGIFDRSVYQQQGRRWGNLEQKDVQDLKTACVRTWATYGYTGRVISSDDQFDGLRELLDSGAQDIQDTDSIVNGINSNIVAMTNSKDTVVMPTAIYTNAQIVFCANLELLTVGDRLLYAPIKVGDSVFDTAQLATPVGFLPLVADPFNAGIAGTPVVYPTFIVSEDKLSWQYVEVLGAPGADPQTYEIALTNALDVQYKTLMFGVLELLQSASHFLRLNIEDRSTPVWLVPKQGA